MPSYHQKCKEIAEFISVKTKNFVPEIGLILGSGLGAIADSVQDKIELDYAEIPNFPRSTVQGHAGKLIFGKLYNKNVVILSGRFHFYEGHPIKDVALPVGVFSILGAKKLIVTNASGGINPKYKAGDVMIIKDMLYMPESSPLIGEYCPEFGGERFDDGNDVYTEKWRTEVKKIAKSQGIKLQEGVFCFRTGPIYEMPAETRMLKRLGADNVCMSTGPEVLMANHCQMEVLGISCITNPAPVYGKKNKAIKHEEVLEGAKRASETMIKVIEIALSIN